MGISRHHFRVSRLMRWVSAFVTVLLAVYLAAVTVMSTAWFRGVLRREVEAKLRDVMGASVEIGGLQFHPWVFQLVLRNLVLHGNESSREAPLLRAGLIVVTVDPASPFRKKLLLHRFDLEDAQIHLRTYPDGSTNLPGPAGEGPQGGTDVIDDLLDLSVGDVTVSRTAVFWNNAPVPLQLSARELAIVLRRSRLRREYSGSVAMSSLELHNQRWALPPITFSTLIEFSRSKLALTSLAWRTAGEPPEVWGSGSLNLDRFPSLTAEASLRARGKIGALAQALDVREIQGGTFDWSGHLDFSGGKLASQGRIEVRDIRIESHSFQPGPLSVAADYTATPQRVNLSKLTASLLGGSVRGRAEVSLGRASKVLVHADLSEIDLQQALHSARAEPAATRVAFEARIGGAVEISWSQQPEALSARFEMRFEPPGRLAGGLEPFTGSASGALTLGAGIGSGERRRPARAPGLTIEPLKSRAGETPALPAFLNTFSDRGFELALSQAEFHLPRTSLKAQGTFGSAQSNLQVQLATSSFDEVRPELELLLGTAPPPLVLKSQATFAGNVQGGIASPAIEGELRVGAFEYGGWEWDGFQAGIGAGASLARITSGHLRAGASSLDFDLTAHLEDWQLTSSSAVDVIARADRTPLEGLLSALNLRYPLSGKLTGRMDLAGTESSLAGGGAIAIAQGAADGEPFDLFSAQVRVAQSVFDLSDIKITKAGGKITGQAKYDIAHGAFSGQLHGSGFSLADFGTPAAATPGSSGLKAGRKGVSAAQAAGQPAVATVGLGGIAAFEISGGGTEQNVQLHGTLRVRGLAVNDSPIGDLEALADWEGSALRFSGQLASADGELNWTGGIECHDDWPIQAKGVYKGLHLEPWVDRLQGARFPGLILADGMFEVKGPLLGGRASTDCGSPIAGCPSKRPPPGGNLQAVNLQPSIGNQEESALLAELKDLSLARLEVQSRTDSLEIQFPSVEITWHNQGALEIAYSAETLRVNRFRLEGPSTDFTLEGSASLGEPASLALRARGRAGARLLSLIDSSIAATGEFALDVSINGTPGHPLLYGALTVRDLNLGYSDLPFRLAGLNGEIEMQGERATIQSLRGAGGGGTLSLSGFATLALGGGAPHYDFRARLEQAHIEFPASLTSVVSGGFHLVGTAENGTLNGELSVDQMFVPDNFDLLSWIDRLVDAFASHPGSPPAFGGKVRLDVTVASQPEVRIDSRNMTAVLELNTSLRGTLADPVIFGDVRIVSGDAKVRGNDYRATRGDITFANPFRTEPEVDLEATTRVQRYDLTVDVSGPLEDARLSFRSQPPLPSQDIVTLLALGYSQSQQSTGVAGTQASFGSLGAGAILSQAMSTQVSSRIQRLFGVSQISINPNAGGPLATSGSTLTVVERPARDFTLTYSTNTSNSVERIIQMEWDLTDRLSVIGVRDQNGVFGLELKFRRSFR